MSGKICRGEMYYADLDPVIGSEQGGVRPVLIIQNNIGNLYTPQLLWRRCREKCQKRTDCSHITK